MATVRPIVQVVADLACKRSPPLQTAGIARESVLAWLYEQPDVKLPEAAFAGESFDTDLTEGPSVTVERFGNFWSFKYDKLDADTPGRVWRSEVSIAHSEHVALVGLRLSLIDARAGLPFFPSVPGVLRKLIRKPGLRELGLPLYEKASELSTVEQVESLVAFLLNQERSRPVLVFTTDDDIDVVGEANACGNKLAGFAHVFVVPQDLTGILTTALGREFSVWHGALRTYHAGFDPTYDEPTAHPVASRPWLQSRFGSVDRFSSLLLRNFAAATVRDAGFEEALPSFRQIRQASLAARIKSLAVPDQGISEREQLIQKKKRLSGPALTRPRNRQPTPTSNTRLPSRTGTATAHSSTH